MKRERKWHDLMPLSDLAPDDVTPARLGRLDLAVYRTSAGVFVSLARCSHQGANLCYGYFDGFTIECPLHQGLFDVRTGKALAAPATRPIRMLECRVNDGMVQVLR